MLTRKVPPPLSARKGSNKVAPEDGHDAEWEAADVKHAARESDDESIHKIMGASSIHPADHSVFKEEAFMKGTREKKKEGDGNDGDDSDEGLLKSTGESKEKMGISLSFTHPNDEKRYRKLMKLKIRAHLIPVMAILAALACTHAIFDGVFASSPFFVPGFIAFIVAATLFALILCAHVSVVIGGMAPGTPRYIVTDFVIYRLFYGETESIVNVVCTISVGFYLLGRVVNGACGDDEMASGFYQWSDYMKCNPQGTSSAPPMDTSLLLYLLPIVCQIYLKGTSRLSMILSWVIGTAFFVTTAVLLNNVTMLWFALFSISFLTVSYEFERFKRTSFIQSKVALKTAVQVERASFEHEYYMISVTQEKDAIEKEHDFMRSLLGNVAHDLKTPLQSMKMDIESLMSMFTASTSATPKNERFHGTLPDDFSSPLVFGSVSGSASASAGISLRNPQILEAVQSLNVACSFMQMAINRALDYTKVTSNIALVPKIESFRLMGVIESQVRMINNMQSTVRVVVDSLPVDLCSYIFSDRHWLGENLLCLLSNAVKYSNDDSVVRVIVSFPGENEEQGGDNTMIAVGGGSAVATIDEEASSSAAGALAMTISSPQGRESSSRKMVGSGAASVLFSQKNTSMKRQQQRFVTFTIEDNGIGLSEAERNALFRPFQQAQRYAGGTGLGLFSLSKRVDALGGVYGVRERADGQRGSSFWFTIPYRPDNKTMSVAASRKSSKSNKRHFSSSNKLPESRNSSSEKMSSSYPRVSGAAAGAGGVVLVRPSLTASSSAAAPSPAPGAGGGGGDTAAGLLAVLAKKNIAAAGAGTLPTAAAATQNNLERRTSDGALGSEEDCYPLVEVSGASASLVSDGGVHEGAGGGGGAVGSESKSSRPNNNLTSNPGNHIVVAGAEADCRGGGIGLPSPINHDSHRLLSVSGLRVLVVDDAMTILKVVSKHIKQAGHFVETAKNGFLGLQRMTESFSAAQRRSERIAAASSTWVTGDSTTTTTRVMITTTTTTTYASTGRGGGQAEIGEIQQGQQPNDDGGVLVVGYVDEKEREAAETVGGGGGGSGGLDVTTTAADDDIRDDAKILDLVLMDIQMPVMDGIEAVRRYRAIEHQYHQQLKQGLDVIKEEGDEGGGEERKAEGTSSSFSSRIPTKIPSASTRLPREVASIAAAAGSGSVTGGGGGDRASVSPSSFSSSQRRGFRSSPSTTLPALVKDENGRTTRPPPLLLIVGMSANSDSESKRLAKEAGMDYFLEKPFTMEDFNVILQRIYMNQHPEEFIDEDDEDSVPASPAVTLLANLRQDEDDCTDALSPDISSVYRGGGASSTVSSLRRAARGGRG